MSCDHKDWDLLMQICNKCGITAEAIASGRDREPTWEDVDSAFKNGVLQGKKFCRTVTKKRYTKLGYYICLRTFKYPSLLNRMTNERRLFSKTK